MDFCHPCQRHLNGALACPGCGAPAQSLSARADAALAQGYPGTVAGSYGQQTFAETPARPYAGLPEHGSFHPGGPSEGYTAAEATAEFHASEAAGGDADPD